MTSLKDMIHPTCITYAMQLLASGHRADPYSMPRIQRLTTEAESQLCEFIRDIRFWIFSHKRSEASIFY